MTNCDFYLKNNTPYEVTLLRADGSDWGQWLGYVAITANSDKFVKVEDMKCPRASGETDHWGNPATSSSLFPTLADKNRLAHVQSLPTPIPYLCEVFLHLR